VRDRQSFRVFVSSTFGDLARERTVLDSLVFPQVADWCANHGASFRAVDLRWGISEAASRQRRTMDVCLSEVRRCVAASPSFSLILLLGDRYGWRPVPARIDGETFGLLVQASSRDGRELLRASYRLDENARPGQYLLLPRDGPGRRGAQQAEEVVLRSVLDHALATAFRQDDSRQVTYGASATHLEVAEALGGSGTGSGNVLVFARKRDPGKTGEDRRRLDAFEAEMMGRLGRDAVHRYSVGDDPELTLFRAQFEETLRLKILETSARDAGPRAEPTGAGTPLFWDLAVQRAQSTVGLARVRDAVTEYVRGEASYPLVITGAVGSGKSTALAAVCGELQAEDDPLVIGRFAGAVPEWTNRDDLLRGLCAEIDAGDGQGTPPPWSGLELELAFAARLATPRTRPLHVYIDGVDQLEAPADDEGPAMRWVPRVVGPGMKLVLTATDEPGVPGQACRALRQFLPAGAFVPVDELSLAEAEILLSRWLEVAERDVQAGQRAQLLKVFSRRRLPLLLRLMTDQAIRWRSYDVPRLGQDEEEVIRDAIDELAADADHGAVLVRAALAYLSAARFGLSDDEMIVLLGSDTAVMADLAERSPYWPLSRSLPYVVWARLRTDLGAFVTDRAVDGEIVSALAGRTIQAVAARRTGRLPLAHGHLSRFFSGELTPGPQAEAAREGEGPLPAGPAPLRVLSELPFQLTQAGLWPKLAATLRDPAFIDRKCSAGHTSDLVHDYERAQAAMRNAETAEVGEEAAALRRWSSFLIRQRASIEEFAGVEGFVLQQIANEAPPGLTAAGRGNSRVPMRPGTVWFRRDRSAEPADPVIAELRGHAKGATDCVFDATGELLFSSGMDGRVLIWSTADWSLADVAAELGGSADSCDVSPDGHLVATACADGFVRIHDLKHRTAVMCETHFELGPRRCRFTRDGRSVIAVGRPGVAMFDASTGARRYTAMPGEIANDCTVLDRETAAVGDCDGNVSLVNLATGGVRQTLGLDQVRRVQGACLSPEGRYLVAVGGKFQTEDEMAPFGEKALWDTSSWRQLDHHFQRLDKPALNCVFVDGGRFYAVGLWNGVMRVFRTEDGALVNEFKGHDNGVRGMAVSPDGSWLATAAFDGVVKIWRVAALAAPQPVDQGGQGLFCLLDASDGGWALTAMADNLSASISARRIRDRGEEQSTPRPLDRPRELAGLQLQRRDPGLPMRTFAWSVPGVADRPSHRTAPVAGPGWHWIIHAPARMWPPSYHLLPEIDASLWSADNVTWAQSPSGYFLGLVRRRMKRPGAKVVWTVELLIYTCEPGALRPLLSCAFDVPLGWEVRSCSFDPDEDCFLAAVGPAVYHLPLLPSATISQFGGTDESGQDGPVQSFSVSRDGALLALGYLGGEIRVFDAQTRDVRAVWRAHRGDVVDCAYLDDSVLASIGTDGALKLWDPAARGPRAVFVGNSALAAFDASMQARRAIAVDIHGKVYWLTIETAGYTP
jgi:NACHT domain- and WD repeat-containing protein